VSILASGPTSDCPSPGPFRLPPWDDQHPRWLEIDQRLPADHRARLVAAAVDRLDLGALRASYHGTGTRAYPPHLLLRAVLYDLHCGRGKPADWYHDAHDNEPLRWLLRGCEPSRARWYAFRDRLAPFVDNWNRDVLAGAQAAGLTAATRGALDGSAVAANASRHRLIKAATLDRRLEQLEAAVAADSVPAAAPACRYALPMVEAAAADAAVPAGVGAAVTAAPADEPAAPATAAAGMPPPIRPKWMAQKPLGRRQQRQRYRQARQRLGAVPAGSSRPLGQTLVSVTDPQAALGLDKSKVFRPLYNLQLLSDLDSPLLLAYQVFAQPTDAGLLGPMLQRACQLLGHVPDTLLADTVYAAGPQLAAAEAAKVTLYAPPWPADERVASRGQIPKSAFTWLEQEQTYVCPQGHRLTLRGRSRTRRCGQVRVRRRYQCAAAHCAACPRAAQCLRRPESGVGRSVDRDEYEAEVQRLRARMGTALGQELYRLRSQVVERGFADLKEHRGLRRASGRGLVRVQAEAGLRVLIHNLGVLQRSVRAAPPAPPHATSGPIAA
jgi:transposase